MLFFVCYVGYEYAMCNFTLNKLCYVMLCSFWSHNALEGYAQS